MLPTEPVATPTAFAVESVSIVTVPTVEVHTPVKVTESFGKVTVPTALITVLLK